MPASRTRDVDSTEGKQRRMTTCMSGYKMKYTKSPKTDRALGLKLYYARGRLLIQRSNNIDSVNEHVATNEWKVLLESMCIKSLHTVKGAYFLTTVQSPRCARSRLHAHYAQAKLPTYRPSPAPSTRVEEIRVRGM